MKKISSKEIMALEHKLKSEFQKQLVLIASSAFAFVAALFWRDAFQEFLTSPTGLNISAEGSWVAMTAAAIIVTLIAVFAMWAITRAFGPEKK